MIYENSNKQITLTPISETEKGNFVLTTRDGRESLSDRILRDVDEYCEIAYDDGPRKHLGASLIGHDCERYLWFVFRWMGREHIKGRTQRLLNRGHREEERFIEWLTGIGCTVSQVDELTGKQYRISDCGEHFGGSCDGIVTLPERYGLNVKFLAEFKTKGTGKGFNDLKNNGVYVANPQHWIQQCVYGYKLKLRYALYMSINKNDDDIHGEIVELDWQLGAANIEKAAKIINSQTPPLRLSDNASFWQCKFCPLAGLCHHFANTPPDRNCRSCQAATPVDNAQWHCSLYNQVIPAEYVPQGCPNWESLPY